MVRRKILVIMITALSLILIYQTSVFAKVSHFRAFIDNKTLQNPTNNAMLNQTILYTVSVLQKLEYTNNAGTNQYLPVNSAQTILNYTNQAGNNYAVAIYGHGAAGNSGTIYFNNGASQLNSSSITGNWHLVILNVCYLLADDTFPKAFNTVGYDHRATLGFRGNVYFDENKVYWKVFNDLAGSDSLGNIADYANSISGCYSVVYGDWNWNGYAWF